MDFTVKTRATTIVIPHMIGFHFRTFVPSNMLMGIKLKNANKLLTAKPKVAIILSNGENDERCIHNKKRRARIMFVSGPARDIFPFSSFVM